MANSQARTVVGNGFLRRLDDNDEVVRGRNLKYLDCVHRAGVYVTICFYGLYEFAKFNSGPLLPGIKSVEDTVKAFVRRLYDNFHLLPLDALRFFDHKVDVFVNKLDSLVPLTVKRAVTLVRAATTDVRDAGVVDAAKNVVKSMYKDYEPRAREALVKYEPVVRHYVLLACQRLIGLPSFPQAAMLVNPMAGYWVDKYKSAVQYGADRQKVVLENLPLMPTEKIAKMFEEPKVVLENLPLMPTEKIAKMFEEPKVVLENLPLMPTEKIAKMFEEPKLEQVRGTVAAAVNVVTPNPNWFSGKLHGMGFTKI